MQVRSHEVQRLNILKTKLMRAEVRSNPGVRVGVSHPKKKSDEARGPV